jgi:hypothetical protein
MTGIVFRAAVRDRFGLFPSDIMISDVALELRIAAIAPYVVSKRPCALFLAHPESTTVRANARYIWREYTRLMAAITGDHAIPGDLRGHFTAITTVHVRRAIFGIGRRAIARNDHDELSIAASILEREYGLVLRGALLRAAGALSRVAPAMQRAFAKMYPLLKRASGRARYGDLQQSFGSYARYLNHG